MTAQLRTETTLPTHVNYPFPNDKLWNEIPLGVNTAGEEVIWDVNTSPHILIVGTTGSGKSITQRTILLHALQKANTMWQVILCDVREPEFLPYRGANNVKRIASEVEDILFTIGDVESEMKNRYERMVEEGVDHFFDLESPPPALLLVVGELYGILSPLNVENATWCEEMKNALGMIARLGGNAGVYLVLATQKPETEIVPGELKVSINARIAQGPMGEDLSFQVLDNDAAVRTLNVAGRGIFQAGGGVEDFQAYFMPSGELEKTINVCDALAAGYITAEDLKPKV